jgi:hypothetical protein
MREICKPSKTSLPISGIFTDVSDQALDASERALN